MVLAGQFHGEHWIVGPKNLGQHRLGEPAGEHPDVGALLLGQLAAGVEADGHAGVRLDEKVVLGKEPRKKHPVPVLVGDFVDEPRGGLLSCFGVEGVAELPAAGPEFHTEGAVGAWLARPRLVAADGERVERLGGGPLGDPAGGLHGVFKIAAERAVEGWHG